MICLSLNDERNEIIANIERRNVRNVNEMTKTATTKGETDTVIDRKIE